jgi:hypothetical protein
MPSRRTKTEVTFDHGLCAGNYAISEFLHLTQETMMSISEQPLLQSFSRRSHAQSTSNYG